MLTIATCLWDANGKSLPASRCFDESWADKLYRGFVRNLSAPFRFVCFSDRRRAFNEAATEQQLLGRSPADYGCYIEPFRIDGPLIIAGLDTVVVRNIDHLADYCESREKIALPRDPYRPEQSINAIALVPPGHTDIFERWHGQNDMEWLRQQPWIAIDDLWPGQVVSLKAAMVRDVGLQQARIVYFHGRPKPQELPQVDWVRKHWR